MAVSYMNLIRALVSQLRKTQALGCGGGGCGGGGCGGGGCGGGGGGGGVQTKNHNIPEIFNFGDVINRVMGDHTDNHNVPDINTTMSWEILKMEINKKSIIYFSHK